MRLLFKAKKLPIGTVSKGRKKIKEGLWLPVGKGKGSKGKENQYTGGAKEWLNQELEQVQSDIDNYMQKVKLGLPSSYGPKRGGSGSFRPKLNSALKKKNQILEELKSGSKESGKFGGFKTANAYTIVTIDGKQFKTTKETPGAKDIGKNVNFKILDDQKNIAGTTVKGPFIEFIKK